MTMPPRRQSAHRAPGKTYSLEDVARMAGVAPMTISRAINKPETVSPATRAIVQAAIEQTGYIPNRLAGGLASTNRSRAIGLILPHIGNSSFSERVQGMTEVLVSAGYNLLLALSDYSPEAELRHVISFLGQRVAGLALTGATHADRVHTLLKQAGIPVVETSSVEGAAIDMRVGYSNQKGAYAMVEHLARCGYRRIGLISTPAAHNDRSAGRQSGYRAAVRTLGLTDDPNLVVEIESSLSGGARAFVQLMSQYPNVDAVMCTNDILAIGCMLEARRRAISVPDDIGIAGFDDIDLAQEFVPGLTTVRIPRYEIGATAARLLLERLEDPNCPARTVDLGFEIVARGSTRNDTAAPY